MSKHSRDNAVDKTDKALFSVRVGCPHCGLPGIIALDRTAPNNRVRCQRCARWFRISPQGIVTKAEAPDAAITVAVQGSSGWTEHLAPESGRRKRRPRSSRPGGGRAWLGWKSCAAVALVAAFFLGAWQMRRGDAEQPGLTAAEESEDLAGRVSAFTAAWVSNDTPRVAAMAAPSEQGFPLVNWLSTGVLEPEFEGARANEVKIETLSVTGDKDPQRAVVVVGIELLTPGGSGGPRMHRLAWREIEGKWCFSPIETLRILRGSAR
jgi:hypothetical protein